MKAAMADANKYIIGGLNEAVSMSLSKLSEKMDVKLEIKR
jgi:hypothetical protein